MIDSEAVLRAAREVFVAGRRVEVGDLADAAGVNRTTLYRRWGGRDGLLAEVLWSVTSPTIDAAYRQAPGIGPAKIAAMMSEFAAAANQATYFHEFLRREPECALRILTTRAGRFQPRIVEKIHGLIRSEVDAGRLESPLPTWDLALILVRITETFVYANLLTGAEPDAVKVHQACAVLLGAAPPGVRDRGEADRWDTADGDAEDREASDGDTVDWDTSDGDTVDGDTGAHMEIRNVTAADAGRLSEMFARLSERDITATRDDPRDWVPIDRLGSDADFRWVALDGERIVGWAILNRLSGWSDHVGELRLIVDPGARRSGVGRALAQEAVRAGFADGLAKLVIELPDSQDPVVQMFTDLGFAGEARLRSHIRDSDGVRHDLIVLARHANP